MEVTERWALLMAHVRRERFFRQCCWVTPGGALAQGWSPRRLQEDRLSYPWGFSSVTMELAFVCEPGRSA